MKKLEQKYCAFESAFEAISSGLNSGAASMLREMDRRFDAEGIVIPYPVAIELDKAQVPFESHEHSERMTRRKAARQHIAEIRQAQEDLKFQEERESARVDLEYLKEQLEQGNLRRQERELIERDIEALEGLLSRYAE